MSNVDFTTSANPEILATEVACLKATLTLILKSIGQADAGKVIINMERFIAQIEDPTGGNLQEQYSANQARLPSVSVASQTRASCGSAFPA